MFKVGDTVKRKSTMMHGSWSKGVGEVRDSYKIAKVQHEMIGLEYFINSDRSDGMWDSRYFDLAMVPKKIKLGELV